MELDGEAISIEQSSPSDNTTGLNTREDFPFFNNSFNNADGMINHADSEGRISMVAAVAGQNTPNYFDQDNFYPADGQITRRRRVGNRFRTRSDERRQSRQVKGDDRRDARLSKKDAKTAEIQSRADLNREVGKEKQSDLELAKALQDSGTSTPMSTTTKVLIGAGIVGVLGAIVYFTIIKKK